MNTKSSDRNRWLIIF